MNKSILGKLDEKKEKGFKPLARCPVSCLIHVCHNSFRKGVKQYGDNAMHEPVLLLQGIIPVGEKTCLK